MNFLQPGEQLTAARWNDIFTQADAQLTTMLGGLSAVFALCGNSGPSATPNYADKQWDRGFFFGFDPVNPPNTLHPVALQFIKGYLGQVQSYQNAMFWRQYSHSAITGQLSGLSQLSNTSKWNVVKLALPTWASWSAAVYPSGFGTSSNSGLKQTISSVDYPAYNCLDVSLQVHKASVSGTPYNVTFDTVLDAEHAQPFKGIDVFTLGNFSWDTTNWDKYSVVRVHNVGKTAATATFGSASATLPPGGCKCFRKISSGWIVCLNYFHTMQTGDGRFLQMRETGNPANNGYTGGAPSIFMPGIVTDVLFNVLNGWGDRPTASAGNFGMQPDVTRFFDLSPVYNNPAYAKSTPNENNPPANGYFPVPSSAALIGDLILPRGKFLVANRAVPQIVHATMNETVVMTLAVPAPTYDFADGTNTVANVSNAAVYNVTTGQSIPMQSDPSDISTVNWQVNYGTQKISILPRGSVYDPGSGTMIPVVPAPYAPFISNGDVLRITFDYIPPDDHVWVDFDNFSTLAAKLTAVGLASRTLSETYSRLTQGYGAGSSVSDTLNNLEIYSSAGWHLIDLSCPLVTFLTGGTNPAKIVGSTQGGSPPSLKLPWLLFMATKVADNPTSTALTYKNWATDSNGNPVVGATVNVTVNNAGSTQSDSLNAPWWSTKVFLPTDSIAALQAWIQSESQAGGILQIGNFNLFSTPFGHVMSYVETWPLDARFYAVNNYYGNLGQKILAGGIVYEPGVGLHVTRLVYLNNSLTNNAVQFKQSGIFPPIGPASSYLFWHYARVDRQFTNPRWYQHLSADTPWMPNTGWSNQKFPTGALFVWSDEISTNEFNSVVSFYEATPIGVDTVGTPSARAKSGISRMGTFSRSADIWSPFSYWLQKVSTLTYPNGASTASINTSSGWYYANTSGVMANATISDPIPSVLPCQMEHFNAIGSLVNGIPTFKWVAQNTAWNTSFTLNFAAANILIVNGGSGFTVGQSLNFNLKVASVDSNGAITGVAQNGSVVVNIYDAYSTPVRPFALGGNATCDTSVGDGSTLNFIPKFAPIGVQVPSGLTGTYWPRDTFFGWNGATPGGADPLKDYLVGLGLAVQTSLPDGYGTSQPIYAYDLQNDGSITSSRVTSYGFGFTPDFQTKAQTYRWLKVDDCRSLYGNLSLPFVLNAKQVPYKFILENITGTVTPTVSTSGQSHNYYLYDSNTNGFDPNLNGRNPYYAAPTPWTGPDDTSTKYCDIVPGPIKHIPTANNLTSSGFLGHVNEVAAGWSNDAAGSWVTNYGNQNLCSASSPVAPPAGIYFAWTQSEVNGSSANYDYSLGVGYVAGTFHSAPDNTWNWQEVETWTHKDASYSIAYPQPSNIIAPPPVTQLKQDLNSVLILLEGCADLCVACLPQNVAYYDLSWCAINSGLISTLGTQVIPIIADNSVESSLADVAYISGAGGAGQYETIITTGLLNARLVTVPVDGQIQNNNNPPPGGGI